jgi:ATP-dependent exoDNAse (exonuclease V) alpha subunit
LRRRARHLAAQAACLITRPLKRHVDADELKQQWAERAAQAGFSRQDAQTLLARPTAASQSVDLARVAQQALAADGVTREQPTFGQGALLRELISRLPAGAQVSTAQLLDTTAAVVSTDEVVPVLTADGRAYTTRDLLSAEAETLALATRTDQTLAAVDRAAAAATVARARGLRPEQQRVAYAMLTSGLPVEVITGPAGCGKTAGLALATDAWRQAGVEVAGTAVAALTAQGLQAASGAPSVSLARALSQPDRHLPVHGVLLVDEAGMVGTRQLHQLLAAARQRECKVVLVGDPDQLPELEAGGMFARLASTPTTLQLHDHGRQRDQWEREALDAIRQGDVAAALNAYAAHGRLSTSGDREALQTRAVADYLAARAQQPDPWQVVLLANTRQQVRELNAEVRAKLLANGVLSKDALTVDTDDEQISFRVGDQVLVTRNDHRRGLLNGTTATVAAIDCNGLTLADRNGRSATVGRTWLEAGHLEHGYAMTLHKAQGRTVHTALLVGDDGLSTQAGYVGMSRGTAANHLFLAQADVEQHTQHCAGRLQFLRPAQRAARAPLRRDARQALASDLLPRAANGRDR